MTKRVPLAIQMCAFGISFKVLIGLGLLNSHPLGLHKVLIILTEIGLFRHWDLGFQILVGTKWGVHKHNKRRLFLSFMLAITRVNKII